MRVMPDSKAWYVSYNLEIRSTCFHLGLTGYGCMFDFRNALILSPQFVTRGLLPIISSKRWMQLSTPICTPRSPLY